MQLLFLPESQQGVANFQKYEKQSYNGVISMEVSVKCYDMYIQ